VLVVFEGRPAQLGASLFDVAHLLFYVHPRGQLRSDVKAVLSLSRQRRGALRVVASEPVVPISPPPLEDIQCLTYAPV
jgi:hypothetical protein